MSISKDGPKKMTGADVLKIKFYCNDLGQTVTVRGYLTELFGRLWSETESFSGKRPFGNSGWEYDLNGALVGAGAVHGEIKDGEIDWETVDEDAAYELISEAIKEMGREP